MSRRTTLPRLAFVAALALPAALASGCSNDANTPAGKTAEEAVGVKSGSNSSKTVDMKREVLVQEEKKVVDAKTGEVLSDKKTTTPVTITEEKSVKTDVKVNVGDPSGKK